jgi:hypothetical protein
MADFRDDKGPDFPPHLAQYRPEDGWADHDEWWDARIDFAREHGVYGWTASGSGKILPLLQELVAAPAALEKEGHTEEGNTSE